MNEPLVSVVVITYNSSEYILEGLESVKAQTYKNIELIISDDCSTDNTVELCRQWLEENKHSFKRTELITIERNTGVAGNLNRGINIANGKWIKTLSGDDKFLPYTIEKYINYTSRHPVSNLVFAKFKLYGNDRDFVKLTKFQYESLYNKIKLDKRSQYKENLKYLFVPGPGLFYKKAVWEQIGGYDEKYPFCEEDPFMFRIYELGYKVDFIDEELYLYGVRKDSLGRSDDGNILTKHIRDRIKFYRDTRRNALLRQSMFKTVLNLDLEYDYLYALQNQSIVRIHLHKIIRRILRLFKILSHPF